MYIKKNHLSKSANNLLSSTTPPQQRISKTNNQTNKLNITEWTPGNYTAEIIFNLSDDVVLQQTYSLTIVVEEDTTDTLAETDNADKTGGEDKTENIMKNE